MKISPMNLYIINITKSLTKEHQAHSSQSEFQGRITQGTLNSEPGGGTSASRFVNSPKITQKPEIW